MKNAILLLCVLSILFLGCKDKDKLPDKVNKYLSCGQKPDIDTTHFRLYVPNAYTPDYDFLNDQFVIPCIDSASNVLFITDLTAVDYKGDTVFTSDTMNNYLTGFSDRWDFNYSSGTTVVGTLQISFTVTDGDSVEHKVSYSICSFTCQSLKESGVELDFSKLIFEDQIHCGKGYMPSGEFGC